MSEYTTNPELPIGLPQLDDGALFTFDLVLTESSRHMGIVSLDSLWDQTVQASPSIELVLNEVQESCQEQLPFTHPFLTMPSLDMTTQGFKLGVGLVMYSEFYAGETNIFGDCLKEGRAKDVLPVMTADELQRVRSLVKGDALREPVLLDEDDGIAAFSVNSLASRDSDGLLDSVPGLDASVFEHYCRHADPILELVDREFYSLEEERLRIAFYYGFEQALEMFVQSYETRVLNKFEAEVVDIDTT